MNYSGDVLSKITIKKLDLIHDKTYMQVKKI